MKSFVGLIMFNMCFDVVSIPSNVDDFDDLITLEVLNFAHVVFGNTTYKIMQGHLLQPSFCWSKKDADKLLFATMSVEYVYSFAAVYVTWRFLHYFCLGPGWVCTSCGSCLNLQPQLHGLHDRDWQSRISMHFLSIALCSVVHKSKPKLNCYKLWYDP